MQHRQPAHLEPCGSWLASDWGVSVNPNARCAAAIAGKPAPTGFPVWRLFVVSMMLLVSACASQAPLPTGNPTLPLPLQLHIERDQAGQRQDWLLVIQREGGGIRWSMMDPLGIPQARQKLVNGQWQADGLLPPNPQARELFAALLFALTSPADVRALYPSAQAMDLTRTLPGHWQIVYQSSEVFSVNITGQPLSYRITPLGAAR